MLPLFFAEDPLEAVAVVICSEGETLGEHAVSKGFDDVGAGDFVDVGDEDYVAHVHC